MSKMVAFWREMAAEGGSMAVKLQRIEQFMSLSLAAERRRKGLFEPYFWTRAAPSQTTSTSLMPLLFPDPSPTLTLVDRSIGRNLSGANWIARHLICNIWSRRGSAASKLSWESRFHQTNPGSWRDLDLSI
ncbi:hypothetical protein BDZ97DRAFT_179204 [Flammula alnicola]|nr:hypothetical protein BDZ97DRAFT_1426586 [Flammula alnicola]KAF8970005.1 hypothetical protein BDZ97DRAFT_179204 [Flammula alnicola]